MTPATAKDRSSMIALGAGLALAVVLFGFTPPSLSLWVTALHVVAVIAWMAGMLYLPRLFVYHAEAGAGTPQSETFKVMERRLLKAIVNPAMIVVWVSGLWLASTIYGFQGGWLHAKITLVILLSGLHGYLSASTRRFSNDTNTRSPKHWRIVNEIPTVLLVLIVILVVVVRQS